MHGDDAAQTARDEFDRVFRSRELPSDMPEMTIAEPQSAQALLVALGLARGGGDFLQALDAHQHRPARMVADVHQRQAQVLELRDGPLVVPLGGLNLLLDLVPPGPLLPGQVAAVPFTVRYRSPLLWPTQMMSALPGATADYTEFLSRNRRTIRNVSSRAPSSLVACPSRSMPPAW